MLEREPCEEWIERLSAYADGELAEAEEKEVRAHIDSCETCSEWLDQVRADRSEFVDALAGQKRRWSFARRVMKEVGRRPAHEGAGGRASRKAQFTLVELLVSVGIVVILAAIVFPVFAKAREKARQTECLSNIKQIALAMNMYATDYDGWLPRHYRWVDAVMPYIKNRGIFICSHDTNAFPGYAYNPALAGKHTDDIEDAANAVLLYEAKDGKLVERHNEGANYGFADGHAKWMSEPPPDLLNQHSLGAPTRNYGLADQLRIAYEATEDIEVEDVQAALVQAEQEIKDRDGFLLNSDLVLTDERREAQIVFRVPADAFLETMNALAELGKILGRHVVGEDLTDEYVSSERAVESEAQKQKRLREIERRAYGSREKMDIAEEITESHAQAEKQRGEVRGVLARTVLATGSVRFLEPDDTRPGTLLASAERAWRSSGRAGRVLATGGLWLLAYIPFWGGALALFFLGRRLWRRRQG